MRCPKCGATANDNKCLTHGRIGLLDDKEANKELESLKIKVADQAATIKKQGEKLNEQKNK